MNYMTGIPQPVDDFFGRAHDSFVDITPYIRTATGDLIRLGTVRYRVPHNLAGSMADGQVMWSRGQQWFRGHPNSSLDVGFDFEVKVTWADSPQPETLMEQEIQDSASKIEAVEKSPV